MPVFTPASGPMLVIRITTAILLGIHGWFRLVTGGWKLFGGYLGSVGFPLPTVIAGGITLFEIVGSALLLFGHFVIPVAIGHIVILLAGIAMVHAAQGWFVVGGGRNGVEFSVLLIACLVSIMLAGREKARP